MRLSRSSRICHSPLVTTCPLKWKGGPWGGWCMFIGCYHFWLNSQALRSSQDDLWAIRWQCPSVLCPFALWSFFFFLSAPFSFASQPHAPSCFVHLSPLVFTFLSLCSNFYFTHLCLLALVSLYGKKNKWLTYWLAKSIFEKVWEYKWKEEKPKAILDAPLSLDELEDMNKGKSWDGKASHQTSV